jgi:hypothetical protein
MSRQHLKPPNQSNIDQNRNPRQYAMLSRPYGGLQYVPANISGADGDERRSGI